MPTFTEIQQRLTAPTRKIIITDNANTGLDEMDDMFYQMHFGKTYLCEIPPSSQPNLSPTPLQTWVGPSLCCETLQNDSIYIGQYCLSIEFSISPSDHIHLTASIGQSHAGDRTIQTHTRLFESHTGPIDIQNISSDDILIRFVESFENFERRIRDYETLAQTPETEKLAPEQASTPNIIQPPVHEIAQPVVTPQTHSTEPAQTIAHPFTLKQQVKDLSNQFSPRDFPIVSDLNSKLKTPFQIKTLKNRYGQNTDLILEYSLSISEADLKEQLSRLGHYESLRSLVHQHIFIQEQMQAWMKQNNQPSPGAIATYLNQSILQLRNALDRRITTLLDHQLKNLTSAELKAEFNTFNAQQQHQQAIFKQIDQNVVLGYLDISLLDQDDIKQPHALFTNPNEPPIQISAQHLKNRDGKIILTLIAACDSEKYTRYLNRKQNSDEQNLFIGYTITQKLYPNRPVFIGQAPKAAFPRLECLWGYTDEPTMQPNLLTQIWCIYPMIRTDPAQWIVIAATTDQRPLQTITLENGEIAQEGTAEYLGRSLFLMAQSDDEYTHALAGLLGEALEQKRVKYLHVHQTWDPNTDKPRDIIQMQFQLFR